MAALKTDIKEENDEENDVENDDVEDINNTGTEASKKKKKRKKKKKNDTGKRFSFKNFKLTLERKRNISLYNIYKI